MVYLLVSWLLTALSLFVAARLIPGVYVGGVGAALLGALVLGLVNATLGFLLKIITFPITLVTFGLFLLVINALMFKLAAALVPGFAVRGCLPAILGAFVVSLLNVVLRYLVFV